MGFHHEQTRPDRDQYVRILSQNINRRMLFNFNKYDWNKINSYDVPYDYESIMHYGPKVSVLEVEKLEWSKMFFVFCRPSQPTAG